MRKRKLIVIIVIVLVSANCFAQQKPATKLLQFHSINNFGLLEGQKGAAFQLQTINGIQYKSWFAGVGVGLDYYRYRTIPLFVDVRKEFGKNKNKFFVYGDAGISFSNEPDKQKMPYTQNDKFRNGFYSDAGAGYKIAIRKKSAFLLNIGYSFKKVEETNTVYYYGYGTGPLYTDQPYTDKYHYSLNRMTFKIGWEF